LEVSSSVNLYIFYKSKKSKSRGSRSLSEEMKS
jgi:hypothetical protein